MKKISKERLQEIFNESIKFPLLITNNVDTDNIDGTNIEDVDVHKVITVCEIDHESNEFGLPKTLELSIENGNGQITYGEYLLVNSSIEYQSKNSNPIHDN